MNHIMSQSLALKTATLGGTEVEIAALGTVDFPRLRGKQSDEIAQLLLCSQKHGFFYLDLQNDATCQILESLQGVLRVTKAYFDRPHMAKMRDYRGSQVHG